MINNIIYFDNAATTKPCVEAVAAFNETVSNNYANPSALHGMGINAEKAVIAAKTGILSHFSEKGDFIFTSGATESNNMALFGVCSAYKRRGNKIVSSAVEHPSVDKVLNELAASGYDVVRVAPNKTDDFEQRIIDEVDEKTILVSVMAVNNETGFITDTAKLYRGIKRKNPSCMVHTDGVQGFLKIPLLADYISVSAHKVHGLKGSGGLFIKKDCLVKPVLFGGGQQSGLRSGTEAVELITAFHAAVQNYKYDNEHFRVITDCLINGFKNINEFYKKDIISVNSFNNLPNIMNISVFGAKSEILLHFMAERGIYVSSGSACARGKISPVLGAFGFTREQADSALRLSFSMENTVREADLFIEALKEAVDRFVVRK